ncbi:MAG: hypothetical protein ACRDRU_04270 [Pseudonocardiaceae bacterium]
MVERAGLSGVAGGVQGKQAKQAGGQPPHPRFRFCNVDRVW